MDVTDLNINVRLFNTVDEFQYYLEMIGLSRYGIEEVMFQYRGTIWQITATNNVVFFPDVLEKIFKVMKER